MPNDQLPPVARRAIVRAIARSNGVAPEPEPLEVNLTVERFDSEDVADQLPALIRRASSVGERAPIALLAGKAPHGTVLVSGDHIWRLTDRIEELVAALDALAERALAGVEPCLRPASSAILA